MAYLLIIDDDEDFASATATVLSSSGHEIHYELSLDAARASLKERKPDLVILDVMFPEDSSAGFKMAMEMHGESSEVKDVPILMLTGVNAKFPLGFSEKDIDSDWLPVADFVEKPIDFDVLSKKVSELLAKANAS